ncbi:magnesium transporter [Geomonas sp.]|uniref:magnesium transporter n=1 Tax=Geomonas sp. TaxID=2651584 RepID=UPI002B4991A0|nr:CBS domain-containing protein [Geomonas sp.]HJV35345.1 CBS domain-containing protein [Geomonas sp.]
MGIVKNEIFLSSVLGKTVITSQGREIGTLNDLVMVPGPQLPEVSHLLVKGERHLLSVPWQRVDLFNRYVISVNGGLKSLPAYRNPPGDILLRRDILDRQIVDVNGAKVVRVNDLKLGSLQKRLCLFFADVGFRGLLRRMGWEPFAEKVAALLGRELPQSHISWEYVQLLEANLYRLTLTVARDQLKEIHPADLAGILSSIPSVSIRALLDALDTGTAGEAIHELQPELRSRVIDQLETDQACAILENMDPDEAADVLGGLPVQRAQELLGLMGEKEAERLQELLEHKEDTAGGLMNSQFLSVEGELSAEEALALVRAKAAMTDTIYYLYVLDGQGHLAGVVSLKDLLIQPPATPVSHFMRSDVKSVHVASTAYEVLEVVAKYNFVAVPVLDQEEKMAGIITVDDVLELFIPGSLRRKRHRQ